MNIMIRIIIFVWVEIVFIINILLLLLLLLLLYLFYYLLLTILFPFPNPAIFSSARENPVWNLKFDFISSSSITQKFVEIFQNCGIWNRIPGAPPCFPLHNLKGKNQIQYFFSNSCNNFFLVYFWVF